MLLNLHVHVQYLTLLSLHVHVYTMMGATTCTLYKVRAVVQNHA